MNTIIIYLLFEICSLFFMYQANKIRINKKHSKGKIKKSTIYLILSFIPMAMLVCFRDISVGVDTKGYAEAFGRVISGNMTKSDQGWLGVGYILISKIIGFFFGNKFIFMNILIGFITIFIFYKAIWDNSEIPWISLYIFISMCLYYQTFNQARQMLAIAIVLFSIKYIKSNDFKKFCITILIASSIHTSAVIMIPFYFLTKFEINRKNIIMYIILALSVSVAYGSIERIIAQTYYGKIYLGNADYTQSTNGNLMFILRIMLLIVCMIFYKKCKNLKYLYNIAIWCTIFQLLTTKLYILGRVTTYLYIFYIFLIPNIIKIVFKNKQNRNLVILLLVVFWGLYHIVYFRANSTIAGYDIYKFFFI